MRDDHTFLKSFSNEYQSSWMEHESFGNDDGNEDEFDVVEQFFDLDEDEYEEEEYYDDDEEVA